MSEPSRGEAQNPAARHPAAPNPLAGGGLDRAPERRRDEAWLAERFRDPSSRIVPVWRARNLFTADAELPSAPEQATRQEAELQAVLLAGGDPHLTIDPEVGPIFLGLDGDVAYFAVEVPDTGPPTPDTDSGAAAPLEAGTPRGATSPPPRDAASPRPPLLEHGEFHDLRRVGSLLEQREGALLAYARAMVRWHRRHRFCGACGSRAESTEGGHVRMCTDAACHRLHFPRMDPAIIVRVSDAERCLLARKPGWPSGMYSVLAGFVEPGETLEEAVAREVCEETGLAVRDVRYHSSQPWPFPSSLMLGFVAGYEEGPLRVDSGELEDARWFERAELR
ncbi:MAG: NAD(+) diphosphatase, partial [Gemmatimonadota bacterium]